MKRKRCKRKDRRKVIPILLLIPITDEQWVNHLFQIQPAKPLQEDYDNWKQSIYKGLGINDEK